MGFGTTNAGNFSEGLDASLNTNSNGDVTPSLDINGAAVVSMSVINVSGGSSAHVVTLQCSPDNTNWYTSKTRAAANVTVTGEGSQADIPCSMRYIRAKVTTPEGSASVSKIYIQAK